MHLRSLACLLVVGIVLGSVTSGRTQAQPLNREEAPELTLPLQPGFQGFQVANFMSGLANPVAVATPPGETSRLFIVQQRGSILVVPDLESPGEREVFLDLESQTQFGGEQGMLGLAFHPDYAENGRFFVYRTVQSSSPGAVNQRHQRLSEFRVSDVNPNRADPTEIILFNQHDRASNHNGGDLHFGPDGYLYVSTGDEGNQNDSFNNGQRIDTNLFSSILRLDVDDRPESIDPNPHPAIQNHPGNYKIPADNPFIGLTEFQGQPMNPTGIRTEKFAMGLRNPWRFTFDPLNGDLWIADVGGSQRESIFVSRPGANHGWSYREGSIPGPRVSSMPSDFLTNPIHNYVPPVYDYTHGGGQFQGRSVTGGVIYRGDGIPELYGAYVFGDYISGNIWALRRGVFAGQPADVRRLTGRSGVSAFGVDPRNGDVLVVILGGQILRLEHSAQFVGQPVPPTLEETGAFADLETLAPGPGVVPYEVNAPSWSDHAHKRHWVVAPANQRFTFLENGTWPAPIGTAWIQHFDMEMVAGDPASSRRLETRFLVRTPAGFYGVTYRWTSENEAVLVDEGGAEEELIVEREGVEHTQVWRYPSRVECMACHMPASGGALGFNAAQLNREYTYADGTRTNQVGALNAGGFLLSAPQNLAGMRAHAPLDREDLSLESRVRSYLAANCAACHHPQLPGTGSFNTRLDVASDEAGLVNGLLRVHDANNPLRVVVPGDLENSMLLQRMNRRGPGQMPPVGSEVVDAAGSALLAAWIESLEGDPPFVDWLREAVGEEAAENPLRDRDSDGDGASDYLEYLTGTDPLDPEDWWRPVAGLDPDGDPHTDPPVVSPEMVLRFTQPANVAYEVQVLDRLIGGTWRRADLPGNTPQFPAESREVELRVPVEWTEEPFRGFRIRLFRP